MIEDYLRTANILPCGDHVELMTLPGFTDSKTKRNIPFGHSDVGESIITYGYIKTRNRYIVVRTDQLYRLFTFSRENPKGELVPSSLANEELEQQYAEKEEKAMTMLSQHITSRIKHIKDFYLEYGTEPWWLSRKYSSTFWSDCMKLAKQYKKLTGNNQLIITHIKEWLYNIRDETRKENQLVHSEDNYVKASPSHSQHNYVEESPSHSQHNAVEASPSITSDLSESEFASRSPSESRYRYSPSSDEEDEEQVPNIVEAATYILNVLDSRNSKSTTDTRIVIIDAFFDLFERVDNIPLRDGAIKLLEFFPATTIGGNKHKKHQKTRKNKIIISTKKSYSKQKNTRNKITVRRQHLVSKQKNTRSKRNLRTRKQVSKPKQKNTRKKRNRRTRKHK